MTQKPAWLRDIEDAAGVFPVLLVEGDEDVRFFEYFLDQHSADWRQRFRVAAAEGKRRVFQGVKVHRLDWAGVADLDEGTPVELEQETGASSRLRALPRFCIESYYCDPMELWATLPEKQRQALGHDAERLCQPIYDTLPAWVAHGAMWRVLRTLYRENRLPGELDAAPVTDEDEIRRILEAWHRRLSPDVVLEQYHREMAVTSALPRDEQIRRYVHGKRFYNQVVLQHLDHLFSGRGAADWQDRFRSGGLRAPHDLHDLLNWIVAQFPSVAP